MISINFYLKTVTPNKQGQVPVIAQIAFQYKKIRISVGKAKTTEWNKKTQRMKLPELSHPRYNELAKLNHLLDSLRNATNELSNKSIIEKQPITEGEIRNLLSLDFDESKPKTLEIFDAFDEFINVESTVCAANTIRGYKTVRNYLIRFKKESFKQLSFDTIDSSFADQFLIYSFDIRKVDNDYFVKIVNVLKKFLNWAKKRNYFTGVFPEELQSIREKENDVIFLTVEELMILNDYKFPSERLNQARDMFCFACFTGFRHSDAHTLLQEHINNGIISKNNIKTQKGVKIPINKYAQMILDKYSDDSKPIHQISNQKANDYIKECCGIIAKNQGDNLLFNRKTIKRKVSGRNVTEEIKLLHEAITFHVARKTFITNSLILGANLQVLQEMGAPKNQRDLKKYIKISDAFKSQVMKDTWDKL